MTLNFQKVNVSSLINKNILQIYLSLFLLLVSGFLFILFGPIFQVKNINIIRNDSLVNIDIAYNAADNFRTKKIFFLDEKDLEEKLKNYQENIQSVKIETILPNTIKITLWSSPELYNTVYKTKNYIITKNGTYIPSKPNEEIKSLNVIYSKDKNQFIDYKKILDADFLKLISNTVTKLEENIIDIKIKALDYYVVERELHITLENNTLLIYLLNDDIYNQVEKTAIFDKEQLKITDNSLLYIDFRINGKVFYCDAESEYQCSQNIKRIYSQE